MSRKSATDQIVYNFICSNPGLCTYEIAKRLRMSGGRIRYTLKKLKEVGLVSFKFDKRNPRIKKLTFPVDMWKLLPRKIKNETKKLMLIKYSRRH